MPIVDITGFTADEIPEMLVIRKVIQVAFKKRWDFNRLDTTTVNFLVDPSIDTSLGVHAMARVTTTQLNKMNDDAIRDVCWEVQKLLEQHGNHTFNEAWPPGYTNIMCGGWKEGCRPN